MTLAESAKLRVLLPRRGSRSNYMPAHLLVSSRIYWTDKEPEAFIDFRGADSLELSRLDKGSWHDVAEFVKEDFHDGRHRITVRGRMRTHNPTPHRKAQIEIIADTPKQHEVWLDQIRARIAPWKLLQQQLQDLACRTASFGAEEFEKAVGGLVPYYVTATQCSSSTDDVRNYSEQMEKLAVVDGLIDHGTAVVETGAALAKLVESVKHVTEIAEFVGNVSKGVAGVSTVFQLVALGARGVSMCAEASRGRRVLPVALGRIVILLRNLLQSLMEIMSESQSVDETEKNFVFDALKRTIDTMDMAETQVLRGRGGQIVNSANVQEVQQKIEDLALRVMTTKTFSMACVHSRKLKHFEEDKETFDGGLHHVRPSTSAFFAGRSKELRALKCILEEWGSAVITQYGGVGKTALMNAFADRAEKDDLVPGGIFWVTVDGGESDVVGSLAGLVEKLTRRRMSKTERRDANLVFANLKLALQQREGRWLLCLDNADNSKLGSVMNQVCAVAGPQKGNGWVIITSRQRQPQVCSRMKSEQELVLEPLCDEDAMVALWRQSQSVETSEKSDEEVMAIIKALEGKDRAEFSALKELCGGRGGHGLGGLPLALVQAGSFIRKFKYSFENYLSKFNDPNKKGDFQDIMMNTEDSIPIRESQRSIWTTWKISVDQLTPKAYTVLRAMAMLGEGGVEEKIVKEILRAAPEDEGSEIEDMFRKFIVEELGYGSSLVCCDGIEGHVYRMHRLVRQFILNGMKHGSDMWNKVYSVALVSVHEVIENELKNKGCSFDRLPDVFAMNHREFNVHALSLIDHYKRPGLDNDLPHFSVVEEIHYYCGAVTWFFDNPQEEVNVWKRLLDIYHHQRAENQKRSYMARFLEGRCDRFRRKHLKSNIAEVSSFLGTALMKVGKLDEALSKLKQSLEMTQKIHRRCKMNPNIAKSLHDLANLYCIVGKLDEAAELYAHSLKMYQTVRGTTSNDSHIALSLSNLANVYREQGKLGRALEMQEECLEMRRTIHGHFENHPDIAHSLHDLAYVYYDQGNLDRAAELYEESLEMHRTVHGAKSPHSDIATSLCNLANVYREQGKLNVALEMHKQSLEMRRAIRGHDNMHRNIAHSLHDLGTVYYDRGNYDQAAELYNQSLVMYREVYGAKSKHSDIAIPLCSLANVYLVRGKLDRALDLHKQSLEIRRIVRGHDSAHPDIAQSLHGLACVYYEQGNYGEAERLYIQSLEMRRTVHGANSMHSHIALSLCSLANVYRKQGKLEESLKIHEEGLKMRRLIHRRNKSHPDIAYSLQSIALVLVEQKKLDQAVELFEQSVEMLRNVHGRSSMHRHITEACLNLADAYDGQGRRDDVSKIRDQIKEAD